MDVVADCAADVAETAVVDAVAAYAADMVVDMVVELLLAVGRVAVFVVDYVVDVVVDCDVAVYDVVHVFVVTSCFSCARRKYSRSFCLHTYGYLVLFAGLIIAPNWQLLTH